MILGNLVTVRYKAGKEGYQVISNHSAKKSKISQIKSSNTEWVESILSRTTRKPKQTTTSAPVTTTTTKGPFLTRELQLQLQQLLSRKNNPERSRSSEFPEYFRSSHSSIVPRKNEFHQKLVNSRNINIQQKFAPQSETYMPFIPQRQKLLRQQQQLGFKKQITLQSQVGSQQKNQLVNSISNQHHSSNEFIKKNSFHLQRHSSPLHQQFSEQQQNKKYYVPLSQQLQQLNFPLKEQQHPETFQRQQNFNKIEESFPKLFNF